MTEFTPPAEGSDQAELPVDFSKNMEQLEDSSEIGKHLARYYEAAVQDTPSLAGISISASGSSEVSRLGSVPGFASPPWASETGVPSLTINTKDGWEYYSNLLRTRSGSAMISAEKTGIDPEDMTIQDLAALIFLHELGHIKAYLEMHTDPEAYSQLQEREMSSLPWPGRSPGVLIEYFKSEDGRRELKALANQRRVPLEDAAEQELTNQEIAYRRLSKEDYPDQFAAKIFNLEREGYLSGAK